MAVIGGLGSAVWKEMAQAHIQTKHDTNSLRDAQNDRAIADLEAQITQKQMESAVKQQGTALSIAGNAASAVRAGIDLGQTVDALGKQSEIKGNLREGIQHQSGSNMDQLLDTDLGDGRTVADVLGNGDRDVAARKMDMILSGNFSSPEDLQAAGFTEGQAKALMGMKESGGEITVDEAVDFVYSQGPHAAQLQREKDAHTMADKAIGSFQQISGANTSRRTTDLGRAREKTAEDKDRAEDGRKATSRMSWLAVEGFNEAKNGLLNKRNEKMKG